MAFSHLHAQGTILSIPVFLKVVMASLARDWGKPGPDPIELPDVEFVLELEVSDEEKLFLGIKDEPMSAQPRSPERQPDADISAGHQNILPSSRQTCQERRRVADTNSLWTPDNRQPYVVRNEPRARGHYGSRNHQDDYQIQRNEERHNNRPTLFSHGHNGDRSRNNESRYQGHGNRTWIRKRTEMFV